MKDSRAGVFSIGYHSTFMDNLCRSSASGGSRELPKKKTNFDCITESPEKLAKFLDKHKIRPCGNEVICGEECPCFEKCANGANSNIPTDYEVWVAWLKQEG